MNKTRTNQMSAINSTRTNIETKTNKNRPDVRQRLKSLCISFIFALTIAAFPMLMNAQILTVDVGTGSDDLRDGNRAFLALTLTNGTRRSRRLSSGLGSNSNSRLEIDFGSDRPFTASAITSIRIQHLGNRRPGNPLDTHDNWDLRSLRVSLGSTTIYDSARDTRFLSGAVRFTENFHSLSIPLRARADEADFVISGLIGSPRALTVTVQNIGGGSGIVRSIACSASGRSVSLDAADRNLASGTSNDFRVSFVPSGTVTCSVTGVNSGGSAETATANNVFSRSFR